MTHKKQLNPQADDLLQQIDELEGRLGSARDELETSTQLRALGLLAGAIAHEFNNILTPVLSYARVALDSPEDTELSRRALEKAAEGVERASRIASSVLSLAGRDGSAGTEPPMCSPAAALHGALACLGQPLETSGIELRTEIDPAISLRMRLTDLEHVFLNLLLNACRAMGRGGGVVEVICREATAVDCSTWNTTKEKLEELAILEFRDTGPGIDPALLPTIFEPFRRGGGGRNDSKTENANTSYGHGLGLAICRQLIEAAGGMIRVAPHEYGGEGKSKTQEVCELHGAVFQILLPQVSSDR